MDFYLLLPRLLLASVFMAAGTAKLSDLAGSRRALVDFGVPDSIARPFGIVLPLAEIAVAGLLLPARSAWLGGVAALILLAVFTAAVAVHLAKGRAPDCGCFGELRARPIGRWTLGRNALLALCAALIVWSSAGRTPPGFASWARAEHQPIGLAVAALVMVAAITALAWIVLHLFRQQGRVLMRLEALEERVGTDEGTMPLQTLARAPGVGAPAPSGEVRALSGERVRLEALWGDGRPVVLIFASSDCGPCAELLPELSRLQRAPQSRTRIAVINSGSEEEVRRQATAFGLRDVFLQDGTAAADAFGVFATPAGVLVGADGALGSELALGSQAISRLLESSVEGLAETGAKGV